MIPEASPFQVVWEDPPRKPLNRYGACREVIKQLRNRPGEWACIQRHENRNIVSGIAKTVRRVAKDDNQNVESTVRLKDGAYGVWVRWLPQDQSV